MNSMVKSTARSDLGHQLMPSSTEEVATEVFRSTAAHRYAHPFAAQAVKSREAFCGSGQLDLGVTVASNQLGARELDTPARTGRNASSGGSVPAISITLRRVILNTIVFDTTGRTVIRTGRRSAAVRSGKPLSRSASSPLTLRR
jgi:hypothetical protein